MTKQARSTAGAYSVHSGDLGPRDPMKFRNGDVSLDEAVEDIINSGEKFTTPNVDLLVKAVMAKPW